MRKNNIYICFKAIILSFLTQFIAFANEDDDKVKGKSNEVKPTMAVQASSVMSSSMQLQVNSAIKQ